VSPLDLLSFAWGAVSGHSLRTGLSLLGVAIGVCAVVLLTALGEGARRYVTGQFQSLGTNMLILLPGKTETAGALPGLGGAPNDLTLDDARALRRGLRHARHVVPVTANTETVSHRERSRQGLVLGTTHELLPVRRLRMGPGQFLPPLDDERSQPVVVLGSTMARELFGRGVDPVGQVVRIGGWRLRVVGVLAARGTQLGMDVDDIAIVPVGTAMRMFNRTSLFRILIEVGSRPELEPTQARAVEVITERHGEEDVTCMTQEAVLSSFTTILGALTAALAGIAAISLSVAGIGIMNVMLVSVSERTAEIGLLKALGVSDRQVLALFLAEAMLLSTAGGLVGLGCGWLIAQGIMAVYPSLPLQAPVWAILAALGVSIGAGALFGVIPAVRATRLDPVAALQRR
jgi:putative ABC transport system permease protein